MIEKENEKDIEGYIKNDNDETTLNPNIYPILN